MNASGQEVITSVGVWTEAGQVALPGTPGWNAVIAAANSARNVGDLGVALQNLAPEIAREILGELGDAAKWGLNPAGKSGEEINKMGEDVSKNTADTIKQMQDTLKNLKENYDNSCCK